MRTFDSCLNNQSKAFRIVWIVIQYHNCCQLAWTNTVIIELYVHPIIDSTARLVGGMTLEGINPTDVFRCKCEISAKVVRQELEQSRRQPQEIKVHTAMPFHFVLPRGSASPSKTHVTVANVAWPDVCKITDSVSVVWSALSLLLRSSWSTLSPQIRVQTISIMRESASR